MLPLSAANTDSFAWDGAPNSDLPVDGSFEEPIFKDFAGHTPEAVGPSLSGPTTEYEGFLPQHTEVGTLPTQPFQAFPQSQLSLPTNFDPSNWLLHLYPSTQHPAHPRSQSGPMASETPTPAKSRFPPGANRIYCEECASAIAYGRTPADDCEKCDLGQTDETMAEQRRANKRAAQRRYSRSMRGRKNIRLREQRYRDRVSVADALEPMP
jgi:hypothetical protein